MSFGIPIPQFFILCDQKQCAVVAQGPADTSEQGRLAESQQKFVEAVRVQGWVVNLDGQYCPEHVRLLKEAMARQQANVPRVITPDNQVGGRQILVPELKIVPS